MSPEPTPAHPADAHAIAPAPAGDRPVIVEEPCGHCWGQGRIFVPEEAANGEGTVLRPVRCERCLGVRSRFVQI